MIPSVGAAADQYVLLFLVNLKLGYYMGAILA